MTTDTSAIETWLHTKLIQSIINKVNDCFQPTVTFYDLNKYSVIEYIVYNMTGQVRVNIFVVTIVMCAVVVNAFAYRLTMGKSDEKPLVSQRFSINSVANNESVISREVINHVHHQHQQTIGNIHILTNIDIANLITILNTSNPTSSSTVNGQPTDATAMPMTIIPGK